MPRTRNITTLALAFTALGEASVPAAAQSDKSGSFALEEVIVTARRRVENLQEVPLTVNVISAEELDRLNIRKFEDLQNVVAGLTLEEDSIAPNASVRGVRFDTFASGFNPTVEFYLNDAPIVSLSAMQAMFDIGRIEVLRGPQGTLRGRASPSGSITIETTRPNLNEFEGYLDLTVTSEGGHNTRGAINVPLIDDMLAIRLAGFVEENEGSQVETVSPVFSLEDFGFEGRGSDAYEGDGYRISVGLEPTDDLSINAMYQSIEPERWLNRHVESANRVDPGQPASPVPLKPGDRKAVANFAEYSIHTLERGGLEIGWEIGNLALNYAGSITDQEVRRKGPGDSGNFFSVDDPAAPGFLGDNFQTLGQVLKTVTEGHSHEVRFSTVDGLFEDRLDIVVGGLLQDNESTSYVDNESAFFLFGLDGPYRDVVVTPIISLNESEETSVFGNLTWHFGDSTELSGGLRFIDFSNQSSVTILPDSVLSDVDEDWSETIHSLSLKHSFGDELMAYATYGSSWRPGLNVVGDFSTRQSPREQQFLILPPETSDSIELGIKSTWMDGRLRLNADVYYQEFDNYPYRPAGPGTYFVETDENGVENITRAGFVGAVPVTVFGTEVEAYFQASPQWSMSGLFSWSKGTVDDSIIPCNDYLPADGVPDSGGQIPTIDDIRTATDGENLAECVVDYRSNHAPLWTATLQSEYSLPIGSFEGYLRGLLTMYGDSKNDPANTVDDVDAYNLFNLYTGIRDPQGKWDLMFYGKNLADTERVISRSDSAASVGYTVVTSISPLTREGRTGISSYRSVALTAPREFGVNLRYFF